MPKKMVASVLFPVVAAMALAACGESQEAVHNNVGGGFGGDCALSLPREILARDVQAYVDLAMSTDRCMLGDPALRAEVLRIESGKEPAPYLRAVLRVTSAQAASAEESKGGGDADTQMPRPEVP
jgi:hypothetical protein